MVISRYMKENIYINQILSKHRLTQAKASSIPLDMSRDNKLLQNNKQL